MWFKYFFHRFGTLNPVWRGSDDRIQQCIHKPATTTWCTDAFLCSCSCLYNPTIAFFMKEVGCLFGFICLQGHVKQKTFYRRWKRGGGGGKGRGVVSKGRGRRGRGGGEVVPGKYVGGGEGRRDIEKQAGIEIGISPLQLKQWPVIVTSPTNDNLNHGEDGTLFNTLSSVQCLNTPWEWLVEHKKKWDWEWWHVKEHRNTWLMITKTYAVRFPCGSKALV